MEGSLLRNNMLGERAAAFNLMHVYGPIGSVLVEARGISSQA